MFREILNMKSNLMVLFLLFTALSVFGQNKVADKFIYDLKHEKTDSLQTDVLFKWMEIERHGIYDSATYYPKKIIAIGQNKKNPDVEAVGQALLGYYFVIYVNKPQAVEHFLKAMQLGEQRNNPKVMLRLYHFMSFYDDVNSIKYEKKAISLAKQTKEPYWQILANSGMGKTYFKLKQYDLALKYLLQAYEMESQLNRMGKKGTNMDVFILTSLGDTYIQLHNPTLALAYFRLGLKAAVKANTNGDLTFAYRSLAAYFKETHNTDSTFYYTSKFYQLAEKSPSFTAKAKASQMLYEIYKERGDVDNALKYHEIYSTATDSVNSIAKTKKLESLLMQEKERQKELAEKREQEKEEHKINLQYSAIALGLVCFFILFLLLSRTIIVNQKLISFLGTVALLIVFEFLNLLLHPYLGKLTHHSPVFMLLTMVCIAAILVPLHHKIEHRVIHRLVEKNKRVRLAAARKTIEQLDTELKD